MNCYLKTYKPNLSAIFAINLAYTGPGVTSVETEFHLKQ
jgi:hypothetical protein